MSAKTLAIAENYGRTLPRFANLTAARHAMFAERDASLGHLASLDGSASGFVADRTIDSLRALEHFYFSLHPRGFARAKTDRRRFEAAMAYYVGAVATKVVPGARWSVTAYPFEPPRRPGRTQASDSRGYEIGIATKLQFVGVAGMCDAWHQTKPNARHDALGRRFVDMWGAAIPKKKAKRAKPKPPRPASDDAAIARELARLLGLKSNPELLGGTLVSFVRHHLRDDRLTQTRILNIAESMVMDRLLEKVPCVRRAGFRYKLR